MGRRAVTSTLWRMKSVTPSSSTSRVHSTLSTFPGPDALCSPRVTRHNCRPSPVSPLADARPDPSLTVAVNRAFLNVKQDGAPAHINM